MPRISALGTAGLFLLVFSLHALPARAQPALLADLEGAAAAEPSSHFLPPRAWVRAGDRLVFATEYGFPQSRCALWSFDPARAVTLRLAPSPALSETRCFTVLASLGPIALLASEGGGKLFRTDGTGVGTQPITSTSLSFYRVSGLAEPASGGEVYVFYACAPDAECDLWRTDGTRAGTKPLHSPEGGSFDAINALVPWRGRLYFFGYDGARYGLWATDGSDEGTTFVAVVNGVGDSSSQIAATADRLFFSSSEDGRTDEELWSSDGTPEGTARIADFDRQPCGLFECPPYLDELVAVGGEVVFRARRGGAERQLWRSDGTPAGTRKIADLPDEAFVVLAAVWRSGDGWIFGTLNGSEPLRLWRVADGAVNAAPLTGCEPDCPDAVSLILPSAQPPQGRLFVGSDAAHGAELWSVDDSPRAVHLVADLCPGPCDGLAVQAPEQFWGLGWWLGKTYLPAFSGPPSSLGGRSLELWATDGTAAGTERIASGVNTPPAELRGRVYFTAVGGTPLRPQLESTDGTAAGTRFEANVGPREGESAGSDPIFWPARHGVLILATSGGAQRLWRTAGSPGSTVPIPLAPPARGRWEFELGALRVGPFTYFERLILDAVEEGDREGELWRSDGTVERTVRLRSFGRNREIVPGRGWSWRGGCLFLVAGPAGPAFWASDGTRQGTRELFRLPKGTRLPTFAQEVPAGFLFVARVEGPAGPVPQLFVSDGTPAGTKPLTRIAGTRDPIDAGAGARLRGQIYFNLDGTEFARSEIWVTDGSEAGTRRVFRSRLQPRDLFAKGDSLYFTDRLAGTGGCARTLYRWPRGGGEPVPLAEVLAGASISNCDSPPPLRFVASTGGPLFFVIAEEGLSALWSTDGTPAGTQRLVIFRDALFVAAKYLPFVPSGGQVYFTVDSPLAGRELWTSDGTVAETRAVTDLRPGFLGGLPATLQDGLALWNGRLFFAGDDGVHGTEPWVLPLAPAEP